MILGLLAVEAIEAAAAAAEAEAMSRVFVEMWANGRVGLSRTEGSAAGGESRRDVTLAAVAIGLWL